jgi:polysaccharide export outer membrane protein
MTMWKTRYLNRLYLMGLTILLACMALPAQAKYILGSGDTLEITVFKIPDLTRRAQVDIEGRIAFPPLGLVNASGTDVVELAERLRNMLVSKEIARDPQVTISLVEARPFFVSGDVSRAGSYPYQPGFTVRHAIAVAGGLNATRDRSGTIDRSAAAVIKGEQGVLWAELAKQQIREARLKAELNGVKSLDSEEIEASIPVSKQVLAEIVRLETRLMLVNRQELEQQKQHLGRVLEQIDGRIAALNVQKSQEEEGLQQQIKELAKAVSLQERGLTPSSRIAEEQRALLYARTSVSGTTSQIALARREYEETKRQIGNLDERRQIALATELQDVTINIDKLRSQLKSSIERIGHVGGSTVQQAPTIVLYRRQDGRSIGEIVDEDKEISPGDIVEVKVPLIPDRLQSVLGDHEAMQDTGVPAPLMEPSLKDKYSSSADLVDKTR